MQKILSFLFHPILIFSVCYIWSILFVVLLISLSKLKSILRHWPVLRLSQKKHFQSLSTPHALSYQPSQQKMAVFSSYIYHALHIYFDPCKLSNELNYLKSFTLAWGCILSVIDKVLNKFKKSKHSLCHSDPCLNPVVLPSYNSIPFKISKIFSCFGFKISFRTVNKIKISSPKDPVPFETRSGIYCIICSSSTFGHISQTRRRPKAWLDEHRLKVQNEEIYNTSIGHYC